MNFIKDIYSIKFQSFHKKNEILTPYTSDENIPFKIKRFFINGNIVKNSNRGDHAHKKTKQIFVCLYGKIKIKCFDGKKSKVFNLKNQSYGLYIPPTIWYETIYLNNNNSILVVTDKKYIENDYIRNKNDFIKFRSNLK